MRIAFWVRTGNKYGSLEKYIALFAEVCKQQGHDFLLLNEIENTSMEFCNRIVQAGATQLIVGESQKSPLRVMIKTIRQLRKWKPDILQLHFINSLTLPFIRLSGKPLIYQTYHSSITHKISLQTKLLRQLDNLFTTRVLAVSEKVLADEIRAGVNPEHIEKLYLGLRIEDFENQSIFLEDLEPPGWNDTHFKKIITIGRFFPVKGMRYVAEAAIQVLQDRKDIIWWLVGKEGPESAYCRQIIQEANLQSRILMLGQRNDIPALLRQSEFQVVGSLAEGLGLMVLEAAACGVPTIGTQIGGLNETIIDGETGLLVESCSSTVLADATLWMLEHPEKKTIMGIAAKQYIAEKFDSESQILHLLEMFTQDYGRRKLRRGN